MKSLFAITLIILVAYSCGNPAPSKSKEPTVTQDYFIGIEDLFSGQKIHLYMQNKLKNTAEANRYFLKGINSFKNTKDLDSAQDYLIQSILKVPSAKAYYELGNVYLEKKEFQNAIKSYGLAEQLGYEPYSKILYNTACVYALQEEPEMAGQYLEFALQAGYSNLQNINKDPDLESLRKTYHFDEAVKSGLKGMSEPEKLFWLQFKRLFPKLNKPVEIDPFDQSIDIEKMETISYDFEKYIGEMRDEKFSREVSKSFYYYGIANETDQFVSLIYLVTDEYLGEEAPYEFKMAVFDHSGNLIDKMVIAGRTNLNEPVKIATIDSRMNISMDLYETVYEKDPEEHGFYENKIVDKKKIGTEKYKLSGNGKILSLSIEKEIASN